ncbi:hypothetical protein E3U55_07415 [Filobacillus milosensis]|uniref:Uncharacterized protein n=1 Tax=Filobacillus milosensis TaxID=94137 RepID=A0A4Y8ILK6_9BACI|nr:hypothetical protein [Filobacillus milosensis]TFB22123.1 hypothetical protein E3U55_07415 [Filobacillus milosensis]
MRKYWIVTLTVVLLLGTAFIYQSVQLHEEKEYTESMAFSFFEATNYLIMTQSELNTALSDGKITQAEFDKFIYFYSRSRVLKTYAYDTIYHYYKADYTYYRQTFEQGHMLYDISDKITNGEEVDLTELEKYNEKLLFLRESLYKKITKIPNKEQMRQIFKEYNRGYEEKFKED